MRRLEDQVAIVTGGGRGIGRAICLALAREGADIVIAARTVSEIEETSKLVKELGSRALAISTDVRKEDDVVHLISKAMNSFGKIDILVNDAGVAYRKSLVETSSQEYDEIIDTNVKGTFLCTKYALPHMLENDTGRIINLSSGAGKQGIPQLFVYCASKFAIIGMTESLAYEVGDRMRVYAVCPGRVDTGMYRAMYRKKPLLKPEHIAEKVLELCLPQTRAPSGSSIEIYSPPAGP